MVGCEEREGTGTRGAWAVPAGARWRGCPLWESPCLPCGPLRIHFLELLGRADLGSWKWH